MIETIVTDRHPIKFKSWNAFMADIRPKIDLSTNKIEFRELTTEEQLIYRYSLDYIKARAYDELFDSLKKIDFDPYENYSASYIVSQIDKAMCYNGRWSGN